MWAKMNKTKDSMFLNYTAPQEQQVIDKVFRLLNKSDSILEVLFCPYESKNTTFIIYNIFIVYITKKILHIYNMYRKQKYINLQFPH